MGRGKSTRSSSLASSTEPTALSSPSSSAEVMTELGQNLIDALALGSLYALIALGITLVYTVMGMMNFAHGEFIMLAAYALFVFAGLPFAAAVALALLAGIAIALLAERIAFRPVR